MVEKSSKKVAKPFTNWEDFIMRDLSLEKKKNLLKTSTKLFFQDPKQMRRDVWMALIPKEFYKATIETYQKIKAQDTVPIMLKDKMNIDADTEDIFSREANNNLAKLNNLKKILSIFLIANHEYDYGKNWVRIAYILNQTFEEEDAFVFFVFLMNEVLPKDYHLSPKRYLRKHVELRLIEIFAETRVPNLFKNLTSSLKKKGNNPTKKGASDVVKDKSSFVILIKQTTDVLLSNLFTTITDSEAALKIFDMLILEGLDFAQKLILKILEKNEYRANHVIKKFSKFDPTSDDLLLASHQAIRVYLRKQSKGKILKLIRNIYNDKSLLKSFNTAKLKYLEEAKAYESQDSNHTNNSRLYRIAQIKKSMKKFGLPFTCEEVKSLISGLEQQISKRDLKAEDVHYQEFKEIFDLVCPKWPDNVKNKIFGCLDQSLKGKIVLKNLDVLLQLICDSDYEEKLSNLFRIFFAEKDKIDANSLLNMIEVLEDLLDERTKILKSVAGDLFEKIDKDDDYYVEVKEFRRALKEEVELKYLIDMIQAVNQLKPVEVLVPKGKKGNELCEIIDVEIDGNYMSIHSPCGKSPEESFDDYADDDDLQDEESSGVETNNADITKANIEIPEKNLGDNNERNCRVCSPGGCILF